MIRGGSQAGLVVQHTAMATSGGGGGHEASSPAAHSYASGEIDIASLSLKTVAPSSMFRWGFSNAPSETAARRSDVLRRNMAATLKLGAGPTAIGRGRFANANVTSKSHLYSTSSKGFAGPPSPPRPAEAPATIPDMTAEEFLEFARTNSMLKAEEHLQPPGAYLLHRLLLSEKTPLRPDPHTSAGIWRQRPRSPPPQSPPPKVSDPFEARSMRPNTRASQPARIRLARQHQETNKRLELVAQSAAGPASPTHRRIQRRPLTSAMASRPRPKSPAPTTQPVFIHDAMPMSGSASCPSLQATAAGLLSSSQRRILPQGGDVVALLPTGPAFKSSHRWLADTDAAPAKPPSSSSRIAGDPHSRLNTRFASTMPASTTRSDFQALSAQRDAGVAFWPDLSRTLGIESTPSTVPFLGGGSSSRPRISHTRATSPRARTAASLRGTAGTTLPARRTAPTDRPSSQPGGRIRVGARSPEPFGEPVLELPSVTSLSAIQPESSTTSLAQSEMYEPSAGPPSSPLHVEGGGPVPESPDRGDDPNELRSSDATTVALTRRLQHIDDLLTSAPLPPGAPSPLLKASSDPDSSGVAPSGSKATLPDSPHGHSFAEMPLSPARPFASTWSADAAGRSRSLISAPFSSVSASHDTNHIPKATSRTQMRMLQRSYEHARTLTRGGMQLISASPSQLGMVAPRRGPRPGASSSKPRRVAVDSASSGNRSKSSRSGRASTSLT